MAAAKPYGVSDHALRLSLTGSGWHHPIAIDAFLSSPVLGLSHRTLVGVGHSAGMSCLRVSHAY